MWDFLFVQPFDDMSILFFSCVNQNYNRLYKLLKFFIGIFI